jgi:hypothetical protein
MVGYVPLDLPGAVGLFSTCDWRASHDTLGLVADLPDYRATALASGTTARAGVTITPAAAPTWLPWWRSTQPRSLIPVMVLPCRFRSGSPG